MRGKRQEVRSKQNSEGKKEKTKRNKFQGNAIQISKL